MEAIIKRVSFEIWVNRLYKRALILVPFFAFPVVNPIFTRIFYAIFDWAFDETYEFMMFHIIKFRNDHEKKAFKEITEEFRKVAPTLNSEEIMNGPYRIKLRNQARSLIKLRL